MTVVATSPPGNLRTAWLIARRAAVESLHDRLTVLMSLFLAVVLPIGLVVLVVRPLARASERDTAGDLLTFYMLLVGLMPAVSAVGIASGQFAGEKERGVLTPLLASPASNLAIFGGKVIGSVIPPLIYAFSGEIVYLASVALLLGPDWLRPLPVWLGLSLLALVPGVASFAAIVASLISSRVRTFNAAQQVAGIVLMPVWGVFLGLAVKLQDWGPITLFAALAALLVLDIVLTIAAAASWRREEVLSHT